MHIRDALVTIDVTREVVMHLPDKSMADLLNTPPEVRAIQRSLLRKGRQSTEELAAGLGISVTEADSRLSWLADRGFIALESTTGGDVWTVHLKAQAAKKSPFMTAILDSL
jgi:hypothetical protein